MLDSKTSLGLEATLSLREVTQETVNSILNLRVTKEAGAVCRFKRGFYCRSPFLGGCMVSRNLCRRDARRFSDAI